MYKALIKVALSPVFRSTPSSLTIFLKELNLLGPGEVAPFSLVDFNDYALDLGVHALGGQVGYRNPELVVEVVHLCGAEVSVARIIVANDSVCILEIGPVEEIVLGSPRGVLSLDFTVVAKGNKGLVLEVT